MSNKITKNMYVITAKIIENTASSGSPICPENALVHHTAAADEIAPPSAGIPAEIKGFGLVPVTR